MQEGCGDFREQGGWGAWTKRDAPHTTIKQGGTNVSTCLGGGDGAESGATAVPENGSISRNLLNLNSILPKLRPND